MGSVTSHSMENFIVFYKSALPKYCSDEPLLLVCDHTLVNKIALLPMLKNNLWAETKFKTICKCKYKSRLLPG